jgi:hypothetical protein
MIDNKAAAVFRRPYWTVIASVVGNSGVGVRPGDRANSRIRQQGCLFELTFLIVGK